jgi:hypothetical protein
MEVKHRPRYIISEKKNIEWSEPHFGHFKKRIV